MIRYASTPDPDPESVLAAFRISGPITGWTPVSGAWSNRVFRLEAGDRTFAVKHLLNTWGIDRWEHWLAEAFSFELVAIDAGVAAPQPVPNPLTGGALAWAGCENGPSVPVRVHHWVGGQPYEDEIVDVETARWAGRMLAVLHGLGVKPRDRDLFPVPNVDNATAWPELTAAARRAKATWAPLMSDAAPAVASIAELALADGHQPADEVMSHGDIDQKNLIATDRGPVLCDWDVAVPVVPRRELADVALSMACWQDFGIAREVVRAYRKAGGDDAELTALSLGQPLMVGIDWIAFNVDRALGRRPASSDDAATAHRLLPGLLAAIPQELDSALRISEILRT